MYNILLLREKPDDNSHVKDYVQLGGYSVIEMDMLPQHRKKMYELLQKVNLVLIECNRVQVCFDICRQIRELTQIPIIVLSECNGEWEKIKVFESGADDYMAAPYLQMELVARIRAHIERYIRLTRPFGTLKIRDLEINLYERQVNMKGEQIWLRLKEFDILLYMAQRPNKVITKEDIYLAVWKDSQLVDNFYNTVAVHIKRVREKIEEDVDNPQYIQTVWGVGYRMPG